MHSKLDHATIGEFLDGVFTIYNLYVVSIELAVMIHLSLILILLYLFRNKRCKFRLKTEK